MPDDSERSRQIVSRIKKIDWEKVDKELESDDAKEQDAPKVDFDKSMGDDGPANKVNSASAPQDFPRNHPGVWKTTTGNRRSFNNP